jgi:palmitoyl transferase
MYFVRLISLTAVAALALALSASTSANPLEDNSHGDRWASSASKTVRQTWEDGSTEIYLPAHTYHMRWAYSHEKVRQLNENPWGLGVGKTLTDAQGNEHRLYAMAFKDSHFQVEPIAGYARLWQVARKGPFAFKAGFTAFLTSRGDTMHYAPFPGALPLVAVEAGRLSLMSTYIPGGKHSGNVLFAFASYRLSD